MTEASEVTDAFVFLPLVAKILDGLLEDEGTSDNSAAKQEETKEQCRQLKRKFEEAQATLSALPAIDQTIEEVQSEIESAKAQIATLEAREEKIKRLQKTTRFEP